MPMLMSQIEGGNYRLAEKLLEAAAAKLVTNTSVTAVEKTPTAFYLHSEVCWPLSKRFLGLLQRAVDVDSLQNCALASS